MSEKNNGGRPSKFDSIDLTKLEYMAEFGLTEEQMAKLLGISSETIRRYKENPEFCAALKKGKEISDAKVVKALFKRACGYTITLNKQRITKDGDVVDIEEDMHVPSDTGAIAIWLFNRRPDEWRNTQRIEHTGKNGQPIVLKFSKNDEKL